MLFTNIVAVGAGQAPKGMDLKTIGVWVVIYGLLIYFVIMRGPKKKAKAHNELLNSIEEGDEIITSSGIKAEVISKGEEFYEIRVDKGVKLTIKKNAIGTLYKKKGTVTQ